MPQPMPPAAAPLLLGQRYEIGASVGSGGMGTVFRARDTLSGDSVAIKQLRGDAVARDPTLRERFLREHAALGKLNHPSIVRVIEAFEESGDQYLVMEFVTGGSLDALLASDREPLAYSRVLQIAIDLADALTRVHRLDIVHRDIKPSNVLLAPDGSPRLSDFGVAQLGGSASLTAPSAVVGTLDYVCPEALTGRRLDARADLWGLGVLLFEMLAQRRPFGGEHPAAVLHAIVSAEPPDLELLRPGCPPDLADLVYRLLEKDPAQRLASARQVGAELERILEGLRPICEVPAALGLPGSVRITNPSGSSDTLIRTAGVGRTLPTELSPFVGREVEIRAIIELLASPETRLITIRGPGGMGKSRLAREVGRHLASGGADPQRTIANEARTAVRVELVELAPLDSPELILPAIASAAGVVFAPGIPQKEQLLGFLSSRRLVLIIDNFEHLLAGASLLSEIHAAAPGVQVLATSRESLGLSNEHVFDLSGMTGTQLFVACARRVRPSFELTPASSAPVARICDLVSGMPLGITLAAAWMNVLEPSEIADEIASSFEFLEAELRDLPERHHSVRAVFEHSWKLLSTEERRVFAELSTFRGGFTRSAAQAVTAASLRTLSALLNKSLIVREPGNGRYAVHELLRQYAAVQLARDPGQMECAVDKHSAHYTALLGSLHPRLTGVASASARDELASEIDNVRLAWTRSVRQLKLDQLAAAIDALSLFYLLSGYFAEAASVFGSAAQVLMALRPARGSELARLAGLSSILEARAYHDQWRETEALVPAEHALAFLDEQIHPREFALGSLTLAIVRYWSGISFGKPNAKLSSAESALALYRATDDWWGRARALIAFGDLVDPIRGEECFRESTALQLSSGDGAIVLPGSLTGLGIIEQERGDRTQGRALLLQSLSAAEQLRDLSAQGLALERLGVLELRDGNLAAAEAYILGWLSMCREFMPFAELACQVRLGEVLLAKGMLDEAAQCFVRAVGANGSCLSSRSDAVTVALAERGLGDVDARLGRHSSAKARLASALAFFEQKQITWGVVFAADSLGWATCLAGELESAEDLFHKVLRIATEWHWRPWALGALAGYAWVLARTEQAERAVQIAAFVQAHPATEQWIRAERCAPLLASQAELLPPSMLERAIQHGHSLELLATAQAVLEARVPA